MNVEFFFSIRAKVHLSCYGGHSLTESVYEKPDLESLLNSNTSMSVTSVYMCKCVEWM